MYALCLSTLCVANFAAYERRVQSDPEQISKDLPKEEMARRALSVTFNGLEWLLNP